MPRQMQAMTMTMAKMKTKQQLNLMRHDSTFVGASCCYLPITPPPPFNVESSRT